MQATITVGGSPQALTIADGRVWVAVDAQSIAPTPAGSGGGTLRMVSSSDAGFMDPALPAPTPLLYATCAQLVNYPDRARAAGSQLTAEVAQALPTRSADGRTYTFKIRRGFRFSPGSNHTAETFKRSIERTLNPRMRSPWAYTLADVVGARAYMAGKASQIAGVVADKDTLTIRLLGPAPDFLARIAEQAFCAVPTNTPINPNGVRLIPSAGPYYVTSYTPGQGVVLARNPNYHGSRPRHFARIQLAVGISTAHAIAEIEAGTADYVLGPETNSTTLASLASRLASRYGPRSAAAARGAQRYFINPGLQLDSSTAAGVDSSCPRNTLAGRRIQRVDGDLPPVHIKPSHDRSRLLAQHELCARQRAGVMPARCHTVTHGRSSYSKWPAARAATAHAFNPSRRTDHLPAAHPRRHKHGPCSCHLSRRPALRGAAERACALPRQPQRRPEWIRESTYSDDASHERSSTT